MLLLITTVALSQVIGCRIETCEGCTLNSLPHVKDFVHNEAKKYDAVELVFIDGALPEIEFLDEFGRIAKGSYRMDLAEYDFKGGVQELLASKGITKETPKPKYSLKEFIADGNCRAWRETADCNEFGMRVMKNDADCRKEITPSHSGYCECADYEVALVECDAAAHWIKVKAKPVPYYLSDDGMTSSPHPTDEFPESNKRMSNPFYYYNTQNDDSSWDRPPNYQDPRMPFTCAQACKNLKATGVTRMHAKELLSRRSKKIEEAKKQAEKKKKEQENHMVINNDEL
eukprot:TRINITY_DN2663_c0_g1_i1.p1 TRINITY_DN2663_c0_g1~~TRINITY_DN2663_c0_g1_i1.p1  ORF type:complete len:286 (+),score=65.45 TRINITY_DN2663_c0_g1_i1:84-941(+)